MVYRFSGFTLDIERRCLVDGNGDQRFLRPQALNVLTCLLEHAPALVSREELLREVWGHEALSASGVSQAIREIRRVLGDSAARPKIIATRHGCGYQVVASVERPCTQQARAEFALGPTDASAPTHPVPTPGGGFLLPRFSSLAGIPFALLLGALAADWHWHTSNPGSAGQGLPQASAVGPRLAGVREPEQPAALRQWRAGLESWRDGEWALAMENLEGALNGSPDATAVELDLIATYLDAGRSVEARDLLSRLASRYDPLSRQESLELRALLARAAGHADTAANALTSLTSFFPDALDYKYQLFEVQLMSAPVDKAADTLQAIRELLTNPEMDSRFQLASGRLALLDGRIPEALGSASLLLDRGLHAAEGIRAQASLLRAQALLQSGRIDVVGDALDHSMRRFDTLADDSGGIRVRLTRAAFQTEIGNLEEAERLIDDACAAAEHIGSREDSASCDLERGRIRIARQDFAGATVPLRRALGEFQQQGNRHKAAEALIGLGLALGRKGDIDAAADLHAEAEALARHLNARTTLARVLMCRGDVYSMRQMPEMAHQMYADALLAYDAIAAPKGQVQALLRLAAVQRRMDDNAGAEALTERAEMLLARLQSPSSMRLVESGGMVFSAW